MSTFTSKYLPLIVAVLSVLGQSLSSSIQNFWSAHTETATLINTVLVVLALFLPQPHK